MGDYNNDGWNDLFVTYYGQNALFRNNGNGTFTDVTKEAGLMQPAGCAGTRDARLSTTIATDISICLSPTISTSISRPRRCPKRPLHVQGNSGGLRTAGAAGRQEYSYHNNGDGTFTDVSEKAGMWDALGTYGLSVAACDLDNDGWPDIYVANDSTPATLYLNQKDGTFNDHRDRGGRGLLARRQSRRPAWACPSATITATEISTL